MMKFALSIELRRTRTDKLMGNRVEQTFLASSIFEFELLFWPST